MKLISWNVNGLRACEGKGFSDSFRQLDADFFCLQETKMQKGQLDLTFDGYESYWNYAEKKGYSGTAIFTKYKPLSVSYGLGIDQHDHEGRVITLEMPEFYLVNVYTPNSQDGLKRLDYRMTWDDDFREYVRSSQNCFLPALLTRSVTSIRKKKELTHGGHTASTHARKTQVGVLTTLLYQTDLQTKLNRQAYITRFSGQTTALSSLNYNNYNPLTFNKKAKKIHSCHNMW